MASKIFLRCFVLILFLQPVFVLAQDKPIIRHQLSLGFLAFDYSPAFITLEYKTYFKEKYYAFGIEGTFETFDDNLYYKNAYSYQFAPWLSVGINYKFFKICRFNMGLQLTGYFRGSKSISQTTQLERKQTREGIFLGPEFSLEVKVINIKTKELLIFSKIHTGYGFIHEKYKNLPIPRNETYDDLYGSLAVGAGFRF